MKKKLAFTGNQPSVESCQLLTFSHQKKVFFLLFAFFVLTFSACRKDDHDHEQELITTVRLIFTPTGGGTPVEFQFVDMDGDGGNAPIITNGVLNANTAYSLAVSMLNESVNPAENITDEIRNEGKEHQLFYVIQSGLNLTIAYNDNDADNKPIGLLCNAATGDASSGTLTVVLRHQPNKNAANVATGDITNAGGETDAEVTFDVVIQ
jgi:hypothetical protein